MMIGPEEIRTLLEERAKMWLDRNEKLRKDFPHYYNSTRHYADASTSSEVWQELQFLLFRIFGSGATKVMFQEDTRGFDDARS